MIRLFYPEDTINPNDFSDNIEALHDETWYKYSLEDATGVKAIMCFKNYREDEWALFALFDTSISAIHGRELRDALYFFGFKFSAKKIITYSQDNDFLNRWHKFLGFKSKQPVKIGGKKLRLWELEL